MHRASAEAGGKIVTCRTLAEPSSLYETDWFVDKDDMALTSSMYHAPAL